MTLEEMIERCEVIIATCDDKKMCKTMWNCANT